LTGHDNDMTELARIASRALTRSAAGWWTVVTTLAVAVALGGALAGCGDSGTPTADAARASAADVVTVADADTPALAAAATPVTESVTTAAPATPTLADAATFDSVIQPFIEQHCVKCHGEKKQKGDLRLDDLAADFVTPKTTGKWIEVMDNLNLREMPPDDEPQPDIHEVTKVTSWIASELRHGEKMSRSAGGRVVLRRMNRAEYANTIRDLLGMSFLPGESPMEFLPPDGTAEGFDKVSVALMMDPSLLDKYFEVARRIAQKAIVDGPPKFPTRVMHMEFEEMAENRAIRYLAAKSGMIARENDWVIMNGSTRSFGRMKYPDTHDENPVKGTYTIRVRARGERGEDGEPVVMRVTQSHPEESQRFLMEHEVTDAWKVYEITVPRDNKTGEYNVTMLNKVGFEQYSPTGGEIRKQQKEAGQKKQYERVLRLQSRQQMEGLTNGKPIPGSADLDKHPKLILDWIECEGPLYEQWPPRSHQIVLFKGEQGSEDPAYIREIFQRLMTRAFRRPVTDAEVAPIVDLCKSELSAGATFNDAICAGMIAVLCSPKFLYIAEPSSDKSKRPLNDWEVASRLSYFLWSSMPDDTLFDLARRGKLRDPAVLKRQVDRMIADDKADGFVHGFGAQWLRTDEFRNFMPDARQYKKYNDKLGESMVNEALAFFERVLRHNESALSFIDSDWTMLDERLAEFYGIEGVEGDAFRRVQLPVDSKRGGLLAMAGVAMAGSDGDRTKPVHRGVYVREVLFNDPPDPPPPNAGEVEPNIKGKNLTVRERLIQHQQIETCAACHRNIDGYGLALENFNVIGEWRELQDGENFRGNNRPPIDPSGTLPNGERFSNFDEFKSLLMKQKGRFARGLSEKTLTYALGRPIEPSDRGLVERLATQMADEQYTLRGLIYGVVTSDAFLSK